MKASSLYQKKQIYKKYVLLHKIPHGHKCFHVILVGCYAGRTVACVLLFYSSADSVIIIIFHLSWNRNHLDIKPSRVWLRTTRVCSISSLALTTTFNPSCCRRGWLSWKLFSKATWLILGGTENPSLERYSFIIFFLKIFISCIFSSSVKPERECERALFPLV